MAAAARLAVEAGHEVRGSDNPLYPPTSEMVAALGAPVTSKYRSANLDWGPDVVVIGNALSRGNREVEAVLKRRIPYVSMPEWLKQNVLQRRRPIVICGTHGKTSTASLTAHLLEVAGKAPGFFIGGQPLDFPHSARLGQDDGYFVVEGDEYDSAFFDKRAKFFHYLPEVALVTGIEFDHGDIYGDIEDIRRAFRLMLRQVPSSGRVILCADDPEARALAGYAHSPVVTYGFSEDADWCGQAKRIDGGSALTVYEHGWAYGVLHTSLVGKHNLLNALGAIAVAGELGVSSRCTVPALKVFRGVQRRMEVFHEARGVVFVDDFAHHPTAIAAVLSAAREQWPERRLWAIFEPRSNTTVTNRFQGGLTAALSAADCAVLGPIHRKDTIPEDQRLDRRQVAADLEKTGVKAMALDSAKAIAARLDKELQSGDVALLMSNGAFGGLYALLRERFRV